MWVAIEEKEEGGGHALICALQELGIEFEYFGHDENYSVIQIKGMSRGYWNALKKVGVVE